MFTVCCSSAIRTSTNYTVLSSQDQYKHILVADGQWSQQLVILPCLAAFWSPKLWTRRDLPLLFLEDLKITRSRFVPPQTRFCHTRTLL